MGGREKSGVMWSAVYALTRAWFTLLTAWVWLTTAVVSRVIHAVPGLSLRRKQCLTVGALHVTMAVSFALQPWIRLRGTEKFGAAFAEMRKERRGMVVLTNHVSLLDATLLCWVLPWDLVTKTRTLAKLGLFKAPVVGTVFSRSGHFPVYFKNSVEFGVNKEKQNAVTKRMEEHLDRGGTLTFCPEGTINRGDTAKLLPFRRGSFRLAAKHRLPIWAVVCSGSDKVWPQDAAAGGYPARVDITIARVRSRDDWEDAYRQLDDLKRREPAAAEDPVTFLQNQVCDEAQTKMQRMIDSLQ